MNKVVDAAHARRVKEVLLALLNVLIIFLRSLWYIYLPRLFMKPLKGEVVSCTWAGSRRVHGQGAGAYMDREPART
ncbi:MAG: hypothetical protein LBO67_10070 [Spirochaetaceae bacterium]|nr:hypothetical protein [Spirochaetaceae bacterium]